VPLDRGEPSRSLPRPAYGISPGTCRPGFDRVESSTFCVVEYSEDNNVRFVRIEGVRRT